MEDTRSAAVEEIRDLRGKTEKDYLKQALKSSLLGGYDKNTVLNFIGSLRDEEQKARETFYQQIAELTQELDMLRKNNTDMAQKLTETGELFDEALQAKEKLEAECRELRENAFQNGRQLEEMKKECAGYQEKIQTMTVDFEEFQASKKIQEQYERLLADYRTVADSRDESLRKNAVYEQKVLALENENEKLAQENDCVAKKYSDLLSTVRKIRLRTETNVGEYQEKLAFCLKEALKRAETSLQNLREMDKRSEEFNDIYKKDCEEFRKV